MTFSTPSPPTVLFLNKRLTDSSVAEFGKFFTKIDLHLETLLIDIFFPCNVGSCLASSRILWKSKFVISLKSNVQFLVWNYIRHTIHNTLRIRTANFDCFGFSWVSYFSVAMRPKTFNI